MLSQSYHGVGPHPHTPASSHPHTPAPIPHTAPLRRKPPRLAGAALSELRRVHFLHTPTTLHPQSHAQLHYGQYLHTLHPRTPAPLHPRTLHTLTPSTPPAQLNYDQFLHQHLGERAGDVFEWETGRSDREHGLACP